MAEETKKTTAKKKPVEKKEKYIVIVAFNDSVDGKKYYAGDEYTGSKAKDRMEELTTDKNKYGYPFIKVE